MVKNENYFAGTSTVKAVVRIGPTSDKDNCLVHSQDSVCITPTNQLFTFDRVFGPTSPQSEIFSTIGKDLVSKFIEGKTVTVIAFGQDSPGKTFAMGTARQTGKFDESADGIILRALTELFQVLQQQEQQSFSNAPLFTKSAPTTSTVTPSTSKLTTTMRPRLSNPPIPLPSKSTGTSARSLAPRYKVKVSYINVYNEKVTDLLNDAPLTDHTLHTTHENTKGQIHWNGVNQVNVNNANDALLYLKKGSMSRSTGAAGKGDQSSHSHTIFSVILEQKKWIPAPSSTLSQHQSGSHLRLEQLGIGQACYGGDWIITTSKFHFIDLTGGISSRQPNIERHRRNEGTNIENIMTAPGDTSNHGTHTSYRNAALTRLLKDSIGGDTISVMMACASPKKKDLLETLDTLQYAVWARNIKNSLQSNGAGIWKPFGNLDKDSNHSKPPLLPTDHETSKCALPPVTTSSPGSGNDNNINTPDQQHIITELQQLVNSLDKKAMESKQYYKLVQAELQHFKNLYQQSCGGRQFNLEFPYLVEPVIEEYEKCVGNLQVKNSVLQAAVNYSDSMMDELQLKCNSLQQMVDQQAKTISSMVACQQHIATNIGCLKTKLDLLHPTYDQICFDGLHQWTHKLQKTESQTHSWQPHSTIHDTEISGTSLQQDTITLDLQQQIKTSSAKDLSQEQEPSPSELDKLKKICQQLEVDRDKWKTQAEKHSELARKFLDQHAKPTTNNEAGPSQFSSICNNYHATIEGLETTTTTTTTAATAATATTTTKPSDNKRIDALCAALNTITVERQPSDTSISKRQVEQLGSKYAQSINELDCTLQHYFEMLDYAEHLEHISVMDTTQPSTSFNFATNNTSSLLSLTCNPDTSGTGTISPATDDHMSDWTVLSPSATDF